MSLRGGASSNREREREREREKERERVRVKRESGGVPKLQPNQVERLCGQTHILHVRVCLCELDVGVSWFCMFVHVRCSLSW